MEEAARQFARRVLLVHLALLAVVTAVVYFASREVYERTHEQAVEQFKGRQSLLASQTGRGIQSFYKSIIDDLDLLRMAPSDEEEVPEDDLAVAPPTSPLTRPAGNRQDWWKAFVGPQGGPAANAMRSFIPLILWKQLEGRVTLLFSIDRDRLSKRSPPPQPGKPERLEDRFGPVQVIGPPRPLRGFPPGSPEASLHMMPRDIILRNLDWLKTLEKPQIGPYQVFDLHGKPLGMNFVVVPTGDKSPRLLMAGVDIAVPQHKFMRQINSDGDSTHAILADDTGTIMVSHRPEIIGANVRGIDIPEVAARLGSEGHRGIETVPREFVMGGERFPASLIAVEPVTISGKKWALLVVTPLADVDMVVSRVFKRAVFWAIFVVCSMTAILVSTSIQMIRSRIRMERVRADVLTRELRQAREIQLAWLPRDGVAIPSIDIAAINQPASHISGDFYNWFELPDGRTVVTIGDVTGHGMSAAFLMATTQLLVHNTMLRVEDPGQTLQEVNRQLCTQVFNGQFVTMVVCVIDVVSGTIEVATAGHYPPLMGHRGAFIELPVEPELVLGVEKDAKYPTRRLDLPAGASLVLYTDGVIDAFSPDGQRFGVERLTGSLKSDSESAQVLLDSIIGRINHFRGPRELPDDLTLVCIQTQPESSYHQTEAVEV